MPQFTRLVQAALIVSLLFGVPAFAQDSHNSPSRQLYLLAGTPTTNGSTGTFPVVLYQVGANGKLKLIREVVSQRDGLLALHAAGSVLFALHLNGLPNVVSIIHTEEPGQPDDVVFDPRGLVEVNRAILTAEPSALTADILIPLETEPPNPNKGTLASVSSELNEASSRVRSDAWNEYAALRWDGAPGGPSLGAGVTGISVGNNFAVSVLGHTIVVDALPPSLRGTKIVPEITAVSERYFLLNGVHSSEELYSRDTEEVFVHDRRRNIWKTMQVEGNVSTIHTRIIKGT
jgi:hypothetical protein